MGRDSQLPAVGPLLVFAPSLLGAVVVTSETRGGQLQAVVVRSEDGVCYRLRQTPDPRRGDEDLMSVEVEIPPPRRDVRPIR